MAKRKVKNNKCFYCKKKATYMMTQGSATRPNVLYASPVCGMCKKDFESLCKSKYIMKVFTGPKFETMQ